MAVDESKVLSRTPRLNLPLYKPGATRYDEAINEALQLIDANAVLTPLEADLDMQQQRITNLGDPIDKHDAVPHYLMRLGAAYRRRVTEAAYYRYNEISASSAVKTIGAIDSPVLVTITSNELFLSASSIDWLSVYSNQSDVFLIDGVYNPALGFVMARSKSFFQIKTDQSQIGYIDIVADPEQINGIGSVGSQIIFTTNQGLCYRTSDLVNKIACTFSGTAPSAPVIKNNIITSSIGQIGIYETVDGQTFTQTAYDHVTLGAPLSALRVNDQLFVFTATQMHRFVSGQLQQSVSITNVTDYIYSAFQFEHILLVANGELRIVDLYGDAMELSPPVNTFDNLRDTISVHESLYHARLIKWREAGSTSRSFSASDIYFQPGVHFGG